MCSSALPRKGLRVLIVDGDLDSRELLTTIFDEYELEIIAATSVSESLEILYQTQLDLLISEIALPDETGYNLVQKVKAFEVAHHISIPAIALTGYAREKDRILALAAGFCRHLTKPLDIDELVETVACVTGPVQGLATCK